MPFAIFWPADRLTLGVGMVTLLGVALSLRNLRGTTLLAAWGWACLAAITLVALQGAEPGSPAAFVAAVLTLAPMVAVLGAKRPQHHAWQFIVLSLQAILMMPAVEGMLFADGRMPELHWARQTVLLALIVVGWINYLPTRFVTAATLLAGGQLLLLLPFLAWSKVTANDQSAVWGRLLLAAAVVGAWLTSRFASSSRHPINGPWLAFRDAYGVLWSLRVAERFNTTAREHGWPVELGWSGLHPRVHISSAMEVDPEATSCFDALVSRFVLRPWLARKRGE